MADVKISGLPAAGSASNAMELEVNNAGTSQKVTVEEIRHSVEKGGVAVGTRKTLNFIEGTNITLTITDDSGNDEIDITIAASGSGGTSGGTEYTTSTSDATGTVIATISMASNEATAFEAIAVGRSSTGDAGMWKMEGLAVNTGGTSEMVGDYVKTVYAKDVAAWYVDATVDNGTDELKLWVYGAAATTIYWKMLVRTVKVTT